MRIKGSLWGIRGFELKIGLSFELFDDFVTWLKGLYFVWVR